jgi:hypothetical protein
MSSLFHNYCANVYRMWKNPRIRMKQSSTAAAGVIFTRNIYKYDLWIGCFRDWQHGAVFVNGFNIGRYFQVRYLNVHLSYLQKIYTEILIFRHIFIMSTLLIQHLCLCKNVNLCFNI